MKLTNKGFTLVELLAMLVVLGIIMAVTVPNISGILSSQKTNVLKEDVSKMVDSAKIKVASESNIKKPKNGKCLVFTLKYLNSNDDFKSGPNGGLYDMYGSFVIVKREGSRYKYYVRLAEKTEQGDYYGVPDADYDLFAKKAEDYITKFSDRVDLETPTTASEVKTKSVISGHCSEVQGFYKEQKSINYSGM